MKEETVYKIRTEARIYDIKVSKEANSFLARCYYNEKLENSKYSRIRRGVAHLEKFEAST